MTPATPPLDDAAAMAVFADALCQRGDPRGELVQLQLGLEERPGDPRLVRAEAEHLARNDRALLGGLRTATTLCQLTWRRGYVVEAKVKSLAQDPADLWPRGRVRADPPRVRLARVVRELLSLESAQPLSMLTVQMPYSTFARAHLLACVEEVAQGTPPALRVLAVHVLEARYDDDWSGSTWQAATTVEEQLGDLHVSVDAALVSPVRALLGA